MGLLDGIRSYFREDEQTLSEQAEELDRQRRGDQFGDLPDEIENMSPEEVADTFAEMEQETRLTFMRRRLISQDKWNEVRSTIRNDSKQREFWGIDGTQTVFREGVEVCACHEEGLSPLTEIRGNQETISQTQGTSESSKTEIGGKMGTKGGIGVPGVGNVNATGEGSAKKGRTQGETQQEMAQVTGTTNATRTFHACRVEPTNSTLSRRAFLQAGNFHMGQKYNRDASNTQSTINNWTSTTESTTTQQNNPQKGIDELREEKDAFEEQIEDLDEELEMYDNRINQNKEFISQCENTIAASEGTIDADALDKRDRLLNKHEELQEKKEDIRAKKKQFRTQKHDLQSHIEGHEEHDQAQEKADSSESATENSTEDLTGESEDEGVAEESTDSEQTTETTPSDQPTDDPPESEGPAGEEGSDRDSEEETNTKSPTVEPGADPAEATADAAEDGADQSESESDDTADTDDTDATDEPEANEEQKEYANKGELYLDRYDPSNGQTGSFGNSK